MSPDTEPFQQLNDPVAVNPIETLIERIESTITEDRNPLLADDSLSTLWQEQPPRGIHIWVTLPRPPVIPSECSSQNGNYQYFSDL